MQLHLSTWPEIETYLARSKAILIPIGSTEQHGPNGLLGTDALCPEIIGQRAGEAGDFLAGVPFCALKVAPLIAIAIEIREVYISQIAVGVVFQLVLKNGDRAAHRQSLKK